MYLYEIISDLETSKHGVHIDKFVVAENAKQARQLVADNIQLPYVTMNHLLSTEYDLERFTQPAILNWKILENNYSDNYLIKKGDNYK